MFNNFYQNKKVLVTGHTGFKGSWLSQWLLELGAEVAGFSLYIPSEPSNFEVLNLASKIQDYRGDVRDYSALKQVFDAFKPDVVFHLAAQPIVSTSYLDPKTTFDVNLGGTVNILEALRHSDSVKAAVLITSDKCYENAEWEYGYRENDALGGKDPYSASKACAEIAISAYVRSFMDDSDLKIASARAGNVIGGGDWAKDRIVPDSIKAWSHQEEVVLRNPHATRPWQHVLEPLSGYLWLGANLTENHRAAGQAYNFGPLTDVNQPVEVLIDALSRVWSQDVHWKVEPHPNLSVNKEAGLLKLCCDKALSHLRWQPTLTFDDVIEMTGDWYESYYQKRHDMSQLTSDQIATYVKRAQERGRAWVK